ncbi:MAG: FAD-dependent thymidylate synthase [Planctomycetota bacterium]
MIAATEDTMPDSRDLPAEGFRRVASTEPLVDLMDGDARWEIPVHDHGLVALVDTMPRLAPQGQTADAAIVQAARVSYGAGTKKINEDRGLIRYLMRHWHSTPFEMVELKFHCVMPIFVARQWVRHRTANINEYSARYSVVRDRFYKPARDDLREQSATNRQGRGELLEDATADAFLEHLEQVEKDGYAAYEKQLEQGIARETARIALPQNIYTEWYWKCDLHNVFRFLRLRMDAHAQKEIRDYANAMYTLMKPICPIACKAFEDYQFGGVNLTRLEVEALKSGQPLASENKRENAEWDAKREQLGL